MRSDPSIRLERVKVYYREFWGKPNIVDDVDVQWLTRLGNVTRGAILPIVGPEGRHQHAAVGEARPTADLRGERSQKDLVERRAGEPIGRTIDAQPELLDVGAGLTNIRSRHRERVAWRGSECR